MKLDLNGSWQGLCLRDGKEEFRFDGSVPGCVHTDLMGSRIPADLQYRDHTEQCQWIEDCDWEYSRTFALGQGAVIHGCSQCICQNGSDLVFCFHY